MSEIEEISSIKHPAVAQAKADLSRIVGKWHDTYPVEGYGMLKQALAAGVQLKQVFFRGPADSADVQAIAAQLRSLGIACYRVTPGVFSRIMALGYETSIELLATVRAGQLDLDDLEGLRDECAIVLAGERIDDPRNVGVLIRNADAWGVRLAIFGDCADAYSRAGVRSTTGSIFRLPLMQAQELLPAIAILKSMGFRIIGSSAAAKTYLWQVRLSPPCVIVVGNESVGLSEILRKQCDEIIKMPIYGGAHSLNVTVAAGVLLYEATRGNEERPRADGGHLSVRAIKIC
jgi:tRNA G18 (ribose-2'-O)-methylase SpoU